jgi:Coenzyme PQQ synthesis protein D (PqqD)
MSEQPGWTDASRPRRGASVVTQRARDALVLLDLASGRYYTVEGAGDRVWDLCDGQHTLRDIIAAVSDAYGVEVATVRADSIELLEHLQAVGLVDDAG